MSCICAVFIPLGKIQIMTQQHKLTAIIKSIGPTKAHITPDEVGSQQLQKIIVFILMHSIGQCGIRNEISTTVSYSILTVANSYRYNHCRQWQT